MVARPIPQFDTSAEVQLDTSAEVQHERVVAIDRIKACAIVAVLLMHAGPMRFGIPVVPVEFWLRRGWTIFHVPAFLIVAGTLYRQGTPMSAATFMRRTARVVVPYLSAVALWAAIGIVPLPPWPQVPGALLLGATYGIYYFVPVLVGCIALGWLASRLPAYALWVLLAGLLAYACVERFVPAVMMSADSVFWRVRDPLVQFWFGYFLCGWLAVPQSLGTRLPRWVLMAVALAALPFYVIDNTWVFMRVVYSVAVVAWLWVTPIRFPGMRLLSETSLAIYLLHAPVQDALAARLWIWPAAARVPLIAIVGCFVSLAFCLFASQVVGRERARFWFGA